MNALKYSAFISLCLLLVIGIMLYIPGIVKPYRICRFLLIEYRSLSVGLTVTLESLQKWLN